MTDTGPARALTKQHLWDLAELVFIVLWGLWVGKAYLNFDPTVWPTGRELGMVIRTHYVWTLLPRCGDCVMWNGFVNGGAPAFAELQGAVLHPLVIVATLFFGGINGAKVILLACLILAGWAQWWLAKVMGLGRLPRLWSAAMAVVGGHLAGRMEHGVVELVLSTAMCSLVIPAALDLALTGRRRSAVALGIILALALLSGQVYMQIGLFLSILPAFFVCFISEGSRRRRLLKAVMLAGTLAVLLTASFWLPLLHFMPNFAKDTDPFFRSVQPLEYLPLNLVIRDLAFYYNSQMLGRLPYPYLYVTYIGWVPILLSLVPLGLTSRDKFRQLFALLLSIGLVYLCAGAVTLRLFEPLFPGLAANIRYPTVISGLAVPLVLGLAGWGLEHLVRWLRERFPLTARWPRTVYSLNIWPLLWLPFLLFSLWPVYTFSLTWLGTRKISPDKYQVVQMLKTESTQWVSLPSGEHFWTPLAIEAGLKTTNAASPWSWNSRSDISPYIAAVREATAQGHDLETIPGDISIERYPQNGYAFVKTDSGKTACTAVALGGHIDVDCVTDGPGYLSVQENAWSGWQAWCDDTPMALMDEPILTVPALSGGHHYTFRYRPWDVPIGLFVTAIGIVLASWLWWRPMAASPLLTTAERSVDWMLRALNQIITGIGSFLQGLVSTAAERRPLALFLNEIGRASCRERV